MLNGILLLNKPINRSSHQALKKVKRLLDVEKAGHTGTLDPLATGMLPICLGEATKFSQFLLDADKAYRTTAKLGQTTTTGDAEGELLQEQPVPLLTETDILALLQRFTGAIEQTPSMYSALKHQGQPLYKLAKKGIEIARKSRTVYIRQLSLLEYTANTITLDVVCSKGTYIRSLAEDIGAALGCGAHVAALHRRYTAPFDETAMVTLDELESLSLEQRHQRILPADAGLQHIPEYPLTDIQAARLLQGQRVRLDHQLSSPAQEQVRFSSPLFGFIGLGEVSTTGVIHPRRMMGPELIHSFQLST